VLNNTICFGAFFPLLLSLAASTAAAAAFVSAAASWLARVLPLPADGAKLQHSSSDTTAGPAHSSKVHGLANALQ